MFETCKNTPEYIKQLASRILSGENIVLNCGSRYAKGHSFTMNLFEELYKQAKDNNRIKSYFYHEEGG